MRSPAESRDMLDAVYNASIVLGLYLSSTFVYIMFNVNVTWQPLLIIPMILASVLLVVVFPLKEGTRRAKYIQLPFREIFRRQYFPALVIGLATQFFGSVLGSSPVLSFHQSIYDDLGIAREFFVWYIVILGVAILGGLAASYYLFDYLGRRRSLIIGSLYMSLSMGLVAYMLYFYVGPSKQMLFQSPVPKTPSVFSSSVTILFLSSSIFVYYFCFGVRGWLGSSFPGELMWIGSDVSSSPNTVVTFILASLSPSLLCKLGPATFVVFSAVAMIMVVFVLLLVPETSQMTYATIEDQVWRDHWFWNRYMPRRSRDRVIEIS